ncbi:MAG TPA: metallophosphoesterase [Burkholderiaceae bacterium]|nr:metallophosphoesterase [Burkholderiaceae bacterium]HQR69719.1 metallophosphoesterase [Burkholderiaceae bacterium]
MKGLSTSIVLAGGLGGLLLAAACGGSAETSSSSPSPVTIVAAGDIADCGSDGTQFPEATRTAALVQPSDALVLTLGDNTYPIGAPAEFADCFNPTWGQFKERIRPSPGNHEYITMDAGGYFGYFGAAAGPSGRGYYSFDAGAWHVISLNSNVDAAPGSPQHAWLQNDLAASKARCLLAYWHHPVFSSGPHGNDPRMVEVYRLLNRAGADIVLVGHDHIYERFAPQDADGRSDPQRGVRSFTVGTGGARLYSLRTPQPNSEYRDNSSYGVLRLTLADGSYRWTYVPVNGAFRDEGTAVCHR